MEALENILAKHLKYALGADNGSSFPADNTSVQMRSRYKDDADRAELLDKRDRHGEITQYQPDNPNNRRTWDSLTPREKQDDLATYADLASTALGSAMVGADKLTRPVEKGMHRIPLWIPGKGTTPKTVVRKVPYNVENALQQRYELPVLRATPDRIPTGHAPYHEYLYDNAGKVTRDVKPKALYVQNPYQSRVYLDTGVDRVLPDFGSMGKRGKRATGPISTELIIKR